MRNAQNTRRPRNRSGRRTGGGQNQLHRNLESNGPDIKLRGTASQICEKYQTLARDAQTAGDRVSAENNLQHAEHYYRLMMVAQTPRHDAPPPRHDAPDDAPDQPHEQPAAPKPPPPPPPPDQDDQP